MAERGEGRGRGRSVGGARGRGQGRGRSASSDGGRGSSNGPASANGNSRGRGSYQRGGGGRGGRSGGREMGPYRGRGRGRGRPRGAKQKSAPDTKPERAAQSYRPMGAALTVEEVRTRPCPSTTLLRRSCCRSLNTSSCWSMVQHTVADLQKHNMLSSQCVHLLQTRLRVAPARM